jgi:hypothetical protein
MHTSDLGSPHHGTTGTAHFSLALHLGSPSPFAFVTKKAVARCEALLWDTAPPRGLQRTTRNAAGVAVAVGVEEANKKKMLQLPCAEHIAQERHYFLTLPLLTARQRALQLLHNTAARCFCSSTRAATVLCYRQARHYSTNRPRRARRRPRQRTVQRLASGIEKSAVGWLVCISVH